METLEPQDSAALAALALRFGLLDTEAVVAWADSLVAAADEPPFWAIELALAKPHTVDALLRQVPGSRSADVLRTAFRGLLMEHSQKGNLSAHDLEVIVRRLHLERLIPAAADGGESEEREFRKAVEHCRNAMDVSNALRRIFADVLEAVPLWIRQFGAGDQSGRLTVKLYRDAFDAVHDVLTHEWDPIGVGDEATAQNEYDAYVGRVLHLLVQGHSDKELARELQRIEKDIGLSGSWLTLAGKQQIARRLREVTKQFLA